MKSVLITGASSGIGYEFAKIFGENGYKNIVITARRKERLNSLAKALKSEFDVNVTAFDCDLSDSESCKKIFNELSNMNLEIDVLVNNAGFGLSGEFTENSLESQLEMIRLNTSALVELTGLFLPGMISRSKGGIINVGSTAGFQPGPLMSVYYATKAFVYSFSQAVEEEVKKSGVHVTCLAPGPAETEFGKISGNNKTRLFRLGSVMSARDVAVCGFEGFMKKKPLVIPGIKNSLAVRASKFIPMPVLKKIVKILQSAA